MKLGQVIRYRDSYNGGWYHAVLIKLGWKWATVRDMGLGKRHRIPVSSIKDAVFEK